LTVTDKTACSAHFEVINLSAAAVSATELSTCLTAANVAGSLLTTLNVDVSG